MSIQILPEHGQRHVYFPGQTLRGQVIYTTTKQKRINSATLSFRGKIATEYVESRTRTGGNTHGPRKRSEEVIRLFEFGETLFQGPYDVSPRTFTWAFEFVIPTQVEAKRIGNTKPGFISDGVSPTPPTFDFHNSGFSHDALARIKYKLVVVVDCAGLFRNDDLELEIHVARVASGYVPRLQLKRVEFTPTPQWSSRDLRQESHTLKQKLKHAFSDDPELKTPCITFRAYVHMPQIVSAAQAFEVGFSIKHFQVSQKDPEAPTLILDSLKFALRSHTVLMTAPSGVISLSGDRIAEAVDHEAEHHLRFKPIELPLDETKVPVAGGVKLADWMGGNVFGFVGDFSTYTIIQDHRMKVEAIVRHSESKHQFQMKLEIPFRLLDPHGRDVGFVPPVIPCLQAVTRAESSKDPDLPGYDDDVRPPALAEASSTPAPVKS